MDSNIKRIMLFDKTVSQEYFDKMKEEAMKDSNKSNTMLMSGVTGLKIIDLENFIIYVITEDETKIVTMMSGMRGVPIMGPPRPNLEEEKLSHNSLAS